MKGSKEIYENPQRWADFIAGVNTHTPTEVPAMILARRDFIDHLKQTNNKKAMISEHSGFIKYLDKDLPDPEHIGDYKEFKL